MAYTRKQVANDQVRNSNQSVSQDFGDARETASQPRRQSLRLVVGYFCQALSQQHPEMQCMEGLEMGTHTASLEAETDKSRSLLLLLGRS